LLLSPLAKGLFNRVIAASGSALDIWATSQDPLAASIQVAALSGCLMPNKSAIMDCMLNKSQAELSMAQNMYQVCIVIIIVGTNSKKCVYVF
jgi:carboxylesterase type B